MSEAIRLTIADDHHLFTEGLSAIFDRDPDIEIVSIYHDGGTLLGSLLFDSPDILLLDVKIGVPDGIAILTEIMKMDVQVKVVMLSTYSDTTTMLSCKMLGARGYLLKNTNRAELKSAITRVMLGDTAFELLEIHHHSLEDKFIHLRETYRITRREWEILQYIKRQYTNQMIGEALFLSVFTVETHRKNLMQKLNLKSAVALHQFIQLHEL
jgi:two-component system nitrate/nitrite response regulator NarL